MLRKKPNDYMTVKETLEFLRNQRNCLVETRPQYKFIQRVLEKYQIPDAKD